MNGCPHSSSFSADPAKCSLCIGARASLVTYDPATRMLVVDGVSTTRSTDHETVTNAPPNKGHKAHMNGRRQKTCGQCGRVGHTRRTCNGQEATTGQGTQAMEMADKEDAA